MSDKTRIILALACAWSSGINLAAGVAYWWLERAGMAAADLAASAMLVFAALSWGGLLGQRFRP